MTPLSQMFVDLEKFEKVAVYSQRKLGSDKARPCTKRNNAVHASEENKEEWRK